MGKDDINISADIDNIEETAKLLANKVSEIENAESENKQPNIDKVGRASRKALEPQPSQGKLSGDVQSQPDSGSPTVEDSNTLSSGAGAPNGPGRRRKKKLEHLIHREEKPERKNMSLKPLREYHDLFECLCLRLKSLGDTRDKQEIFDEALELIFKRYHDLLQ